ncbi:hypothetical protein [Streptomyces xylophagus]|uniref:hypothetical protein n=1 Tax=Streptomyces xylophagus TaxID=285514 RepID=UPI00131AA8C4|nr:hypothetical protein [Streptomyces xylophagus]
MSDSVDLKGLLGDLDNKVKIELESNPEVVEKGDALDIEDLPIEARKWFKLDDVVAVVADLKNSTRLGTGKRAASTASIYEATTGGVVKVYDRFNADFLAIQGDGAFALFWGENRYERALCAGITVKTFSVELSKRLEKKWPDAPETGFKVGIASGRILVKRIGTPRNPAQQEPVWAGKPVNYAAKSAQMAERHMMIVTAGVWKKVQANDFLAISCPCGNGPSSTIWTDVDIERVPEEDPEAQGKQLVSTWCETHGAEYCDAIMAGKRKRDDVTDVRKAMEQDQMRHALLVVEQQQKTDRSARRRGMN